MHECDFNAGMHKGMHVELQQKSAHAQALQSSAICVAFGLSCLRAKLHKAEDPGNALLKTPEPKSLAGLRAAGYSAKALQDLGPSNCMHA